MSYDIMVIDRRPHFRKSKEFLTWYDNLTNWDEEVDYDDYSHATKALQNWFMEIKELMPPLNGPYALADDDIGKANFPEADYAISKEGIYVDMSEEKIYEAYAKALELAKKYGLALFDISGTGQLYNPDGTHFKVSRQQAVYEELEDESQRVFHHRNTITVWFFIPLCLLLLCCILFRDSWGIPVGITTLVVMVVFGFWSYKWIENANRDVLRNYQAKTAQPAEHEAEDMKPLLADVLWNFQNGKFDNQEVFLQALKRYNEEVLGKPFEYPVWDKIECIGAETDFILFDETSEEAERYGQPQIHFKADDGKSFTALEILFKLNNELYPLLTDSDFVFFEGIHCYQLMGEPTICRVLLGN